MTTRRSFLGSLGALGAAQLAGCASSGGASPAGPLIDTHHHFYAPEYQKAWLDWEEKRKLPHFPQQVGWSRAKARRGDGQGRRAHRDPVARLDPGRVVRRAGAGCGAHGAHLQRLRRRHDARTTRGASGCSPRCRCRRRRLAEGDRVRVRHAQGGRRRAADQLRRQVAGRPGLPADLRRAEPPQGGGVFPSAGRRVLRAPERRYIPGGDRGAARHDAHRRQPAAQRHLRALPRHQVAVLARRRHRADAGRAHGVFLCRTTSRIRAGRRRSRVQAPVLRHGQRDAPRLDGGADQAGAGIAGRVRQRLPVRAGHQAAALRGQGLPGDLVAAIESGNARRLLGKA